MTHNVFPLLFPNLARYVGSIRLEGWKGVVSVHIVSTAARAYRLQSGQSLLLCSLMLDNPLHVLRVE